MNGTQVVIVKPDGLVWTGGPGTGSESWKVNGRLVSLPTTDTEILPSNPKRKALVLFPPSRGIVTVAPERSVAAYGGLTLGPHSLPLLLRAADWGDIVTGAWHAIGKDVPAVVPSVVDDEWVQYATASSAPATASKAGQAGKRHVVTAIVASYDDGSSLGSVTLKRGTTTVMQHWFTGQVSIVPPTPLLVGGDNEQVSVELSASANFAGGHVVMLGYTLPDAKWYYAELVGR